MAKGRATEPGDGGRAPSRAEHDLLSERFGGLKRQIPLLYAVVVVNLVGFHLSTSGEHVWALGIALPVGCLIVYRLIHWHRLRKQTLATEQMRRELTQNLLFSGILSVLFCAWSMAILGDADPDQTKYVILFATLAAVGSAVSMTSVPRAAELPLLFIALPIAVWAMLSGDLRYVIVGASLAIVIALICRMLRVQEKALTSLLNSKFAVTVEQQRAQASEERFELVGRATNDLVWDWDLRTDCVTWNEALQSQLGFLPEQIKPTSQWWLDHIHPEDVERVRAKIYEIIGNGEEQFQDEYRFQTAAGNYAHIYDRGYVIRDDQGRATRMVGAMQDLTMRKEAERALAESESLNRRVVSASTDAITLIAPDGNLILANSSACSAVGINDASHLYGTPWVDLWPPQLRAVANGALHTALSGQVARLLVENADADGKTAWWDVLLSPVIEDGRLHQILAVARDITQQKSSEDRILWNATHDSLTRLPNRSLFFAKLDEAISDAIAKDSQICLLHLDLDYFKQINDSYGHDAGDTILKTFGARLQALVRNEDTVARLGGDEFAIILAGIDSDRDVFHVADAVLARLREPFAYLNQILDCRASIGASIYPDHGTTPEILLKNADLALYAAKAAGRGGLAVYKTNMRAETQRRASMIQVAMDAVRDDRIVPYYQPKVDLRTGSIAGFEALLRWRDTRNALRAPSSISAAFEELDVSTAISNRIVQRAASDMRKWIDEGLDFGHVAINASGADFRQNNFAERVLEELDRAGVPPKYLQLEVTEKVFIGRTAEHVRRALKLLSSRGIAIALDDFGTGYAALTHLKEFSVDVIKIDRSFVRDIKQKDDDAIIEAVLKLAQKLGITTVAEGVEEEMQAEFLTRLGCDQAQGHLFWKALPASRIPSVLNNPESHGWFNRVSEVKAA